MSSSDEVRLSRNARVRAAPGQVSSDTGEEYVILGLETGRYHGLTGVAARVWSLVQTDTTVAELERVVTDEYDVDPVTAREDLHLFLADLRSRRLIVVDGLDDS